MKGQCVGRTQQDGGNYCHCQEGWIGSNCEQGVCPNDCSAHGGCILTSEPPQCNCTAPYTGQDCSTDESAQKQAIPKKSSTSLTDYRYVTGIVVGVAIIATVIILLIMVKRRRDRRRSFRKTNSRKFETDLHLSPDHA